MLAERLKTLFKALICWSVLALAGPCFAQNNQVVQTSTVPPFKQSYNRHTLTVETLGPGGLYSLNYDYLVSLKSALGFGISYQSLRANPTVSDAEVQLITLPVYANFYFPFNEHRPFVSTAVTFIKAHATANVDLSTLFGGMQWSYDQGEGSQKQTLTVEKADMSLNNNIDVLVAVPSLGAGYEFRTSEGAVFRVQALTIIADKIIPWAGLSFGVGL